MSDYVIQNLSSGAVLVFHNPKISDYSLKYAINWNSVEVLGRMDPIRTFKNTQTIIDLKFNCRSDRMMYIEKKEDSTNIDFFEQIKKNIGNVFNEKKFKTINGAQDRASGFHLHLGMPRRFFYPSYEKRDESAFMKSAPVFKIYDHCGILDGYYTIPNFDIIARGDRANPYSKVPSDYDFSLVLNPIHTKETQIASTINVNSSSPQDTVDKVLNAQGALKFDPDG